MLNPKPGGRLHPTEPVKALDEMFHRGGDVLGRVLPAQEDDVERERPELQDDL